MVLSKGSFSEGMPHPDSVCNARPSSVWDVQLLSAEICTWIRMDELSVDRLKSVCDAY